jgi:hypothetical protein
MYEFIIGVVMGVFGTRIFSKKRIEHKDSGVQVECVPAQVTTPLPIPNPRKSFIPGMLTNFWGKDS